MEVLKAESQLASSWSLRPALLQCPGWVGWGLFYCPFVLFCTIESDVLLSNLNEDEEGGLCDLEELPRLLARSERMSGYGSSGRSFLLSFSWREIKDPEFTSILPGHVSAASCRRGCSQG